MARKYLRRGGRKIEVEPMPNTFTAVFSSEAALAVADLQPPAPRPDETITRMGGSVFRIDVQRGDAGEAYKHRAEAAGGRVFPAYRFKDTSEDETTDILLTDQLILGFEADVSTRRIEEILKKHQLQVLKEYPRLQRTYLVRVVGQRDPLDVSEALSGESGLVFAEPNVVKQHHVV